MFFFCLSFQAVYQVVMLKIRFVPFPEINYLAMAENIGMVHLDPGMSDMLKNCICLDMTRKENLFVEITFVILTIVVKQLFLN